MVGCWRLCGRSFAFGVWISIPSRVVSPAVRASRICGGPRVAGCPGRVRLHRRRRRRRSHPGPQRSERLRAASPSRPRVLRDVGEVDPSTTLLGRQLPLPSSSRRPGSRAWPHPEGELAVARAAARAGLPYTLSTLSTRSIEEVAAAVSDGDQVVPGLRLARPRSTRRSWSTRGPASCRVLRGHRDHGRHRRVFGRRERDVQSVASTLPPQDGPGDPDRRRPPSIAGPGAFVRSDPIVFANVVGRKAVGDGSGTRVVAFRLCQPASSIPRLVMGRHCLVPRAIWDGSHRALKGVQSPSRTPRSRRVPRHRTRSCCRTTAGRQLDGAPAADRTRSNRWRRPGRRPGSRSICDGGIRRGSDILAKPLALGATRVYGRPGLSVWARAGGERGVDRVLEWFDEGFRRTLALVGCRNAKELTSDHVRWV